jgi:hypothetical protein
LSSIPCNSSSASSRIISDISFSTLDDSLLQDLILDLLSLRSNTFLGSLLEFKNLSIDVSDDRRINNSNWLS